MLTDMNATIIYSYCNRTRVHCSFCCSTWFPWVLMGILFVLWCIFKGLSCRWHGALSVWEQLMLKCCSLFFPPLAYVWMQKGQQSHLWACSSITHLNAAVWHCVSLRAPGSSIYYTETHRWRFVARWEILGTCVASKSELPVRVSDFWLFSADALMHHLSWALWSDSC